MSSVSRAIACCRSGFRCSQRTHVVQAVCKLDEHDAHIADHGQQHLAHVFCLPVFAVRKLDLVDLRDAFNDVRHLVAELLRDVGSRDGCVFDRVMQQARGNRRCVQLHVCQHQRYFQRMQHVRLA